MERWSTVADAKLQNTKHRALYSIIVATLQVIYYYKNCYAKYILSGYSIKQENVIDLFLYLQYLVPLLLVLLIYGLIYKNVRENQFPRHLRQTKTNSLLGKLKGLE